MIASLHLSTRILLCAVLATSASSCSIFQFKEYDGFGDWYIGRPGIARTYAVEGGGFFPSTRQGHKVNPQTGERAGRGREWVRVRGPRGEKLGPHRSQSLPTLEGERPWLYGHLRTPELIYNPAFGFNSGAAEKSQDRWGGGGIDGGLLNMLPVGWWWPRSKEKGVVKHYSQAIGATAVTPLFMTVRVALDVFMLFRPFVYVSHDVAKTLLIPFAGVYYIFNGDASDEDVRGDQAGGDQEEEEQ